MRQSQRIRLCPKTQKMSAFLIIFQLNNNFTIFINLKNMFKNTIKRILLRQSLIILSLTPFPPIYTKNDFTGLIRREIRGTCQYPCWSGISATIILQIHPILLSLFFFSQNNNQIIFNHVIIVLFK